MNSQISWKRALPATTLCHSCILALANAQISNLYSKGGGGHSWYPGRLSDSSTDDDGAATTEEGSDFEAYSGNAAGDDEKKSKSRDG